MIIDKLYIEASRRGSGVLKHSYKGESQNCVLSKEIVDNVFNGIKSVKTLVIDGIEPLLLEEPIKRIADAIEKNNVKIGNFVTFSTSDAMISNKSLELLNKLYYQCSSRELCCVKVLSDENDYPLKNIKYEYINQNLSDVDDLISENEGFYRNGFDIYTDKEFSLKRVRNVIHVSANGNVNSGEFLSFSCADNKDINFGSIIGCKLADLLLKNANDPDNIVEMECSENREISFSQYWESLSEDKRGDWFGYIYGTRFSRDSTGYGILKVVEDNPELSVLKDLSDISTIVGLKNEIKPPWFTDNDTKWTDQVMMEFNGYMKILSEMLYSKSPVLEMIDIYYHDLPYKAPKRLKSFIEKFINLKDKENAEKGNTDL